MQQNIALIQQQTGTKLNLLNYEKLILFYLYIVLFKVENEMYRLPGMVACVWLVNSRQSDYTILYYFYLNLYNFRLSGSLYFIQLLCLKTL